MAAGGPERVAHASHRERRIGGQSVELRADRGPRCARVIDPRPDRHEVAGGPQLIDERGGNPQPGRNPFCRRWRRAASAKLGEQLIDPVAHDRVEVRGRTRQADPVPLSEQCAGHDQLIHDGPQLAVGLGQWLAATVRARPRWVSRADLGDQPVHSHAAAERLAALEPPQGVEQSALGEPALAGIDRSGNHDRRQPTVGVRRAPSTAMWIASASSAESA